MSIFKQPISQTVWEIKYRYYHQGVWVDNSIEDTWLRVAKAIAGAEKASERKFWQQKFYSILQEFKFLPGGRILAGAGTAHQVTLFNCFVMDIPEDSLKGIFHALEEGALTLQQGGGVGYDFSVLRPHGEIVKKTGIPAAGPVSFMRIWDATCKVLLSTGARRGAMMGVLRCDHPDIEEFITAKKDPHELRHFNVSVMVSDAFMQAVKNNDDWPLIFPIDEEDENKIIHKQWGKSLKPVACRVYKIIKARELWDLILRSAYDYAEPGVLFAGTINRMNNLWYCEQMNTTNPCGEIPLPAYGACNLGAINLTQFVTAAFTDHASVQWEKFDEIVKIATRFLDNVIDVSRFPLPAQKEQAIGSRRIGLGITGLADFLVMLNVRYGSEQSLQLAREVMRRMAEVTWQTSIDLAEEKDIFPFYTQDYLQGEFVKTLPEFIQHELAKKGIRNSHHNTIAPAGTISLLANNISNGIEPIYHAKYHRHVRAQENELLTFSVKDYAYQQWLEKNPGTKPKAWVDTQMLTPLEHLQIQAAIQPFIDNAISKTINIPQDYPFEKLQDVYTKAYELGLKGCTIFRPNPITGSILEIKESSEDDEIDRCCQFD